MPQSREDLIEALAAVARRDWSAFKAVYAATSMKLYGVVVRILGQRDLAEDVLQDVYLRIWQQAGDFDAALSSQITWMVNIARDRALGEAKRKTMRSLNAMPELPELLEPQGEDDPLATLARAKERRRLATCLERLEPERRRVIRLAYLYGMTRQEIAARTQRPVATVKTWLRRSLAELKDCLG